MSVYKKLNDINVNNYKIPGYVEGSQNKNIQRTYNDFKNINIEPIRHHHTINNNIQFEQKQLFRNNSHAEHPIRNNTQIKQHQLIHNDPRIYNNTRFETPTHAYIEHFEPTKSHYRNENLTASNSNTNATTIITMNPPEEAYVSSPNIFGPPFWFTLHSGAIGYPVNASPIFKQKMRNFIIGIPVMLPCKNCQEHATAYIEKNFDKLDEIVSGRDSLFKFFVDFHNAVNIRHDKPEMSYEDAYKLYQGKVKINRMSYGTST